MPQIRMYRFIALLVPCVLFISSSALAAGGSPTATAHAARAKVHQRVAGRPAAGNRVAEAAPTFEADSVAAPVLLGERAIGPRRDRLNAGQSQAFAFRSA